MKNFPMLENVFQYSVGTLGTWYMDILTTPSDVGRYFAKPVYRNREAIF